MKHIEINLGLACNQNCIFCMSGITREKIRGFESKELLEKEIDLLSIQGYNSIGFLGGEPSIHPDFLSLLSYTKKKGFENIEVISNGSTFHNNEFLFLAIKSGLTRISLSIHSHIQKKEEFLVGGIKNILCKKIKSLENILEMNQRGFLKKEISINIVISYYNYKDIKDTILFLFNKGVKIFHLNFIQLEGTSIINYTLLALKYEEFRPYLLEILSLTNIYKDIKINFESIPWCSSGLNYSDFLKYSEKSIDKEKDKLSRDDINISFRDIINQKYDRGRLKSYIYKCDYCFLKGDCEGIWNRYLKYFKVN